MVSRLLPRAAERGDLAFGTIDSWLLWNLTGGAHLTDVTNASRTMLLDIHRAAWDHDLLELLSIPLGLMPEVVPSSGKLGETTPDLFGRSIPIGGIAGDQHAALFGQLCTTPGMVKTTYGTGAFLLMYTGETAIRSDNGLLTTIAWDLGDGPRYALEGSVFVAGAAVQWLRDGLEMIPSSGDIEALASAVPDTDGVYLVPAFAGLGAPHWDPFARGTIVGLSRGTTRAHLARAALEGIAAFPGAGYRVPLAAVMFVAETTGKPNFVVPALFAAVAAELVMGDQSITAFQRRPGTD